MSHETPSHQKMESGAEWEPRLLCMPISLELTVVVVVELTITILTLPSIIYTFFLGVWYTYFMAIPLAALILNAVLALLMIVALRRKNHRLLQPYIFFKWYHIIFSLIGLVLMWGVGYIRIAEAMYLKHLSRPYIAEMIRQEVRKFMYGVTVYSLFYLIAEIFFVTLATKTGHWLIGRKPPPPSACTA